ncbi:MAG: T9SS type A sorting domain-containing protein [bacterium]|jgi:hypothetical protein|nr:T9SS type A sorting domain-containing protein [bacterium]
MKRFALLVLVCASAATAQTYVGDAICGACHANNPYTGFFEGYRNSGHPWKIFRTQGGVPAANTWPHTPVPPLPSSVNGSPVTWSDVEYVIGNYFWKTRYMNRDGYIMTGVTGETTQWNPQNETWSPYNPGTAGTFDCGSCHTTGYNVNGPSQHGLPGIVGSWAQDGIRCEACHGPGSSHISNPGANPMPGGQECAACHYRDASFRMPWGGGFMKHHQQSEEMAHSPHADAMTCASCHNPHKSTVYNDGGMTTSCTDCHTGNYLVAGMESVACIDCHMPLLGKSAISTGQYVGDVRSHLFSIMTEPIAATNNTYTEGSNTFWNQDVDGKAHATLDYACLGCHLGFGDNLTLEQAAAFATNIHQNHASALGDAPRRPASLRLTSLFPNPFNPTSTVRFETDLPYIVRAVIFDLAGSRVKEVHTGPMRAGVHELSLDAGDLASGTYLLRLTAGNEAITERFTVLK